MLLDFVIQACTSGCLVGIVLVVVACMVLLPNPDDCASKTSGAWRYNQKSKELKVPDITPEHVPVLIVGAGPAGLSLAILLAKQRIKSIIVEKTAALKKWPAAHQLNFRSNEILQRDGGVDRNKLKSHATKLNEFRWVTVRSKLDKPAIARLDHVGFLQQELERDVTWSDYFNIPQDGTEQTLFETISQHSDFIQVRFHEKWDSFEQDEYGNTVSAIIGNGGLSTRGYRIASKYLVDSSGACGVVRRNLPSIEFAGPRALEQIANILVHCDLSKRLPEALNSFEMGGCVIQWVIDPQAGPATIIHHSIEKRMNINVRLHAPFETAETFTLSEANKLVSRLLGKGVPFEIESISPWRMDCQVASKYRVGNIFLCGDSAHRFPPTGGLGMNTGVSDAHNLAWKMGMALRGEAPDTLLDSYETERRQAALDNSAVSYDNFMRMSTVFEVMGLNSSAGFVLSRVLYHLWFIPRPWRAKFMHFVTTFAIGKIMERAECNPELQKKVQKTLDNQRGHYNSYGLDLGYFYNQPGAAIINDDGSEPPREPWYRGKALTPETLHKQMPEWVYRYEPSTFPGSRLPHVTLKANHEGFVEGKSWGKSIHRFLQYDKFTLFTTPAHQKEWQEEASYATKLLTGVVVNVVPIELRTEKQWADIWNKSDMNVDGCLLVRPDAHIAWRSRAGPSNKNLCKVLKQVLHIERNIST